MKAAMKELSSRHVPPAKADDEEGEASGSDQQQPSPPAPEEFVNTGLQRWEEIRSQWLSSSSSSSSSSAASSSSSSVPSTRQRKSKKAKRHAKDIDIDEVIDLIVSNRWRQVAPKHVSSSTSSLDTAKSATRRRDDACFPSPVALPQMVDVLVDLWEAEGLDI